MRRPSEFFTPALNALENAFRRLEAKVPPPIRKTYLDRFVFRYAEQTIQQAIVQKLARMISGLHAVETLLERGLFQEQGMVQRGLDEIGEDIGFLSLGVIRNDITPLHTQFLGYFFRGVRRPVRYCWVTQEQGHDQARKNSRIHRARPRVRPGGGGQSSREGPYQGVLGIYSRRVATHHGHAWGLAAAIRCKWRIEAF
jgi:hypothetical protein